MRSGVLWEDEWGAEEQEQHVRGSGLSRSPCDRHSCVCFHWAFDGSTFT